MRVDAVAIIGRDGGFRPTLGLTRQTRDALAQYVTLRWPTGRRKAVEKEWGLTPEQARSVCEGAASAVTIDAIWKHKNGGWPVLLAVMGAVIGHGLDQHLERERSRHEEQAARLDTLARRVRAGLAAGDRPAHGLADALVGDTPDPVRGSPEGRVRRDGGR